MSRSAFVIVSAPMLIAATGPISWVGAGLAVATLAFMWLGWRSRRNRPAAPEQLADSPPCVPDPPGPAIMKGDLSGVVGQDHASGALTLLSISIEQNAAGGKAGPSKPGERALREVAHTVQSMLRSGDTFLRRDGRHLVAVLPGLDIETSRTLVTRLVHAVDSLRLVTHAEGERRLAITVGRAFMPRDGHSLDVLLEAAIRDADSRHGGPVRRGDSPVERLSRAVPTIPN